MPRNEKYGNCRNEGFMVVLWALMQNSGLPMGFPSNNTTKYIRALKKIFLII